MVDKTEQAEPVSRGKSRTWRRIRRIGYVVVALVVVAPVTAFAIAYQTVDVPDIDEVAAGQDKAVTIYYADGTEMTRIAPRGANRIPVTYADLPAELKHAVYAAEDPDFETSSLDFTGGLAYQYIRLVTGAEDRTVGRKLSEVVKSYKLNNRASKEQILTGYLNTVYLGRSAFSVASAAQAYYAKELADLTASESALIAGMIQNPSRTEETAYTTARWNHVMDTMLTEGWITKEYRDTAKFPALVPAEQTMAHALTGPRRHIQTKVTEELAKAGLPMDKALKLGLKVHTTIDPKAQTAAEAAVDEVMRGQPDTLRNSLTAIDPAKGAVRAYWAGTSGEGLDFASGTLQEPGSAFLPVVLAAGLQKGIGVGTVYDGSSPRAFVGPSSPQVHNPKVDQPCDKQCTLRKATEQSTNTAFVDLGINTVTTKSIADAGWAAGIPREVVVNGVQRSLLVGEAGGLPDMYITIGGGETMVRPFDLAAVYATLAAGGVHREPYFVEKVEGLAGLVYQHAEEEKPAFDKDPVKSKDIAGNVTDVLKAIPAAAKIPCADNRECAGKPGSVELPNDPANNSKAWMVGYTPQLSASVWVGTEAGNVALKDKAGAVVGGEGLPGQLWQKFMDKALAGVPATPFPAVTPIGTFG